MYHGIEWSAHRCRHCHFFHLLHAHADQVTSSNAQNKSVVISMPREYHRHHSTSTRSNNDKKIDQNLKENSLLASMTFGGLPCHSLCLFGARPGSCKYPDEQRFRSHACEYSSAYKAAHVAQISGGDPAIIDYFV